MLPSSMSPLREPRYSLDELKAKVAIGHYQLMRKAREGAAELGLDEASIKECISELTAADFYKTMPTENKYVLGTFQDVYKNSFCGKSIYIKLSVANAHGRKAVVISFKPE